MIISQKYRYIFIHCRKSAGSSIEAALARHLGPLDIKVGGWSDARAYGIKPNFRSLLCLMHPKGISSSIKKIAQGSSPLSALNRASRDVFDRFGTRKSAEEMAHVMGDAWNDYFKFCVVCNP